MTGDMTVLVTGASGTLGGAVLPRMTAAGLDVRPMSRRPTPGWVAADLSTGDGLAEAVRDVDAVVHLASGAGRATAQTDVEGTRRLVTAAHHAGVRHVLYVSIVGVDRVPVAYYRAKLAAEEIVRGAGTPFTNLRATQFPQLVDTILTASSRLGPLVTDRRVLVQPVHVDDVAQRIVAQLADGPAGGTVEFGGPEALPLRDADVGRLPGAAVQRVAADPGMMRA
jgi:uncharacterized protein YbjT (DUF2867 family)